MIFIIFEGLYFRKVIQSKKGGNWGFSIFRWINF